MTMTKRFLVTIRPKCFDGKTRRDISESVFAQTADQAVRSMLGVPGTYAVGRYAFHAYQLVSVVEREAV